MCGDFNLANMDWSTGTANNGEAINTHFSKMVQDNYLYQIINFSTRGNNILDLVLTSMPDKIVNVQGFDDIIDTDHKLISFDINFKIQKLTKVK